MNDIELIEREIKRSKYWGEKLNYKPLLDSVEELIVMKKKLMNDQELNSEEQKILTALRFEENLAKSRHWLREMYVGKTEPFTYEEWLKIKNKR